MSLRYTERLFQGRVVSWMNEIIKEDKLPFDGVDQEIEIEGQRFPDIIIWEKRRIKGALLIELKQPIYDAWQLADEALLKAWKATVPYFATWNVNRFFSWETYKKGDLFDNLWYPKEVASIKSIDEIDRVEDAIKSFLRDFLNTFSGVYYGRAAKPPLDVDERFIYRLRSVIDAVSIPTFFYMRQLWSDNEKFRNELRMWFVEQGWTFTGSDDDFEKASRQFVYLLVDKVIFYSLLRTAYRDLPKLEIPIGLNGNQFRDILQTYFDRAIEKDFTTIYSANFLDTLPPPPEAIDQLRTFIERTGEYDFSKVQFEVLGRVFERLIPEVERHKLGQYYTRPDVVDLIVGFCVRGAEDHVLDPACGAGTFLVRSYYRKMHLASKSHSELLHELLGYDIAKFPAHLSAINLFSRNLSRATDHPRIERRDFFDVIRSSRSESEVFDAVVMNPPYTRQEEMEDLVAEEKKKAHSVCLTGWATMRPDKYNKKHFPDLNRRASIYAYFFIHGGALLKDGGRLGLITSNSWLDVNYGYDLQRFFLENFRIIAVIQSKVERWFVDADINTCITILERCSDIKRRNQNVVKFVQLKRPLQEFVPPIPLTKTEEDTSKVERQRWNSIDALRSRIESMQSFFEDDTIKIYCKLQRELEDEGYDIRRREYRGFRWSKYIDAPKIFFKVLRKGQNSLVPLGELADVGWGSLKTGVDEFFYLSEETIKKWSLEPEFFSYHSADGKLVPNFVIKSPKESALIVINPGKLRFKVLTTHQKRKKDLAGTNVLKYIIHGESQGFHERPTCKSRKLWYDLGPRKVAPILWPGGFWTRFVVFYNKPRVLADRRLFNVYAKKKQARILCAILNSTVTALFNEIYGKTVFGEGLLLCDTYAVEQIPVLDPRKLSHKEIKKLITAFEMINKRPVSQISEEVGMSDRRQLDNVIFDVLNLTEDERKQVYESLIDVVESRVKRAGSVEKRKKKLGRIDIDSLIESVLKEVEGGRLKKFPDEFVGDIPHDWTVIPEGDVEVGSDLEGYYVKAGDQIFRTPSQSKVRYIQYAIMGGVRRIRIPKEEEAIRDAVDQYAQILRMARKKINQFLKSAVPDRRLQQKIKDEVWRRLL